MSGVRDVRGAAWPRLPKPQAEHIASGGWLPSAFTIVHAGDLPGLFVVYGVGLGVQMTLLALLHIRALRLAERLRLNDVERLRRLASGRMGR